MEVIHFDNIESNLIATRSDKTGNTFEIFMLRLRNKLLYRF